MTLWTRCRPKECGVAVLIAAAGSALSYYLHWYNTWSPLVMKASDWAGKLNAHLTWYPFKIRLFQTYATIAVSKALGISAKAAFYYIQYALAFILALLLFQLLRKMKFQVWQANLGVLLLVTSLPILGAHFEPIHTWDDFWVYIFLALTCWYLLDRHWPAVAIAFTLGCFAREQTLIFYPVLLMVAWWDRRQVPLPRLVVSLIAPLVVYGIFYVWVYEAPDPARWRVYEYNFENSARTADSIISLIDGFGFLWVVAAFGAVRLARQKRDRSTSLIFWSALYAVPITTAFATLYTLIRETRILFPPFLFVIPLALWELQPLGAAWQQLTRGRKLSAVAAILGLVILGRFAAEWFWPLVDYGGSVGFRRGYAGISLGLAAAFLLARWYAGRMMRAASSQNKTAP